jgi:uncharacterized glyoxalase superfamily protein PhnB
MQPIRFRRREQAYVTRVGATVPPNVTRRSAKAVQLAEGTRQREGGKCARSCWTQTMAVRFQSLRPILRTHDLDGTLTFWTHRLGFSCDGLSKDDGWASLARDDVSVMIATPNAHVPFDTPCFTGSFYFAVDDVASLWAELKDQVKVAYPMEDFHYGMREFAVYDNNGYMLQFGTPTRP